MLWFIAYALVFVLGILALIGSNRTDGEMTMVGIVLILFGFVLVGLHISNSYDYYEAYAELETDKVNIMNQCQMIEQMKETSFEGADGVMVDMANKDFGVTINTSLEKLNLDIAHYSNTITWLRVGYRKRWVSTCVKDYAKDTLLLTYADVYIK